MTVLKCKDCEHFVEDKELGVSYCLQFDIMAKKNDYWQRKMIIVHGGR